METSENCRICHSSTALKWPANLEESLSSDSFAITDAHYGQTSTIYQCDNCGFMQCSELGEVLSYYEKLEDQSYEQGRKERLLQARALLRYLGKFRTEGRLLDVGAGSGILVEAALESGYQAIGVEPSKWLQEQAANRNLPVQKGILSDIPEDSPYDIITAIDVIEHVVDPVGLLNEIRSRMAPQGIALIVTPDCRSGFARLLGRNWWHYRVAHIGYFNKATLELACEKAGLELVAKRRPGWYFTMDYLWVRLMHYFPNWMRLQPFGWMKRITLPLNLRDSMLFIVRPQQSSKHGAS